MKKISNIILRQVSLLFFMSCSCLLFISASNYKYKNIYTTDEPSVLGRWDITINISGKEYPSWLEIVSSGNHTLVGEYVGISGSARPISQIFLKDGKISFTLPPQWEQGDNNLSFEASFEDNTLKGTMTTADGKTYSWVGVRAPLLHRESTPVWGNPIKLINDNNLEGWHTQGKNQWIVTSGVLSSPASGSNLLTDKTFTDFKLHIQFRYPPESNSGIYLRGRYEVQIEDSKGVEPLKDQMGGVYGFIAPAESVAKIAGQWHTYDITLVGRMVTVVADGKTIICNQEIPGITGGAINSKEAEPGPLLLQGDHGPIEYRNIIITPVK